MSDRPPWDRPGDETVDAPGGWTPPGSSPRPGGGGYGPPPGGGYGPPPGGGYGPPPGGGYGPPPGGFPPYGQPGGWNAPGGSGGPGPSSGKATAAFVLSIVGFIIGIVPSIIALVLSRSVRRSPGQTAASLKAAGRAKVIGIISLCVSTLWVVLIVIGAAAATSYEPYYQLSTGDCFNLGNIGSEHAVHPTSCSSAHAGQAVGRLNANEPAGAAYPGADGFGGIAATTCADAARSFVQTGTSDGQLQSGYLYPSHGDWDNGERRIVCFVQEADGSKITGSLG